MSCHRSCIPPRKAARSAASPPPEFSRDIRQQLAVGPDDNRVWARLWTDAARARDEIALRGRQLFHFVKHQAVRRVRICPVGDFVTGPHWCFEVTLIKDVDLNLPDYPGVLDSADFAARFNHEFKKQPNRRAWLLRELAKEIGDPDSGESPQLRHIAEKSGKSLSFRFRGVTALRWKKSSRAAARCMSRYAAMPFRSLLRKLRET